ncbi:MAG: stimulus-sensing domain-containing protein, partial [Pseudomonadota bacterium]
MDQITNRAKLERRRSRSPLAAVDDWQFNLRDWLGLVSDEKRRRRETARARHRRIRNNMLRGGISPTNSLSRRIVAFNLIGLGLLVVGVLIMNQYRDGLIDQRKQSLLVQAEVIAVAIAQAAATGPSGTRFDPVRANAAMQQLVQPSGVQAQVFDRSGRLTGDTRSLQSGVGRVETEALPPPGEIANGGFVEFLERTYRRALAFFSEETPIYRDVTLTGRAQDDEIYAAIRGTATTFERVNSEGELIVSVVVPIQRFKAVLG